MGALGWLERAHRLAPESPNVVCFLAVVRQAAGFPEEAIRLLRTLTARQDFRQGWTLLAAALLNAGRLPDAAQALAAALSRHVCDTALARLAERIATAAALPGWCAMTSEGALRIGPQEIVQTVLKSSATAKGGKRREKVASVLDLRIDGASCPFDLTPEGQIWPLAPDRTRAPVTALTGPVELLLNDVPLTGSTLYPARALRTEGVVNPTPDGLSGWVWHPGDPDTVPILRVLDARDDSELLVLTAEAFAQHVSSDIAVARYRALHVPQDRLPDGPVRVVNAVGQDLAGSPLDPGLEHRAAHWATEQARAWSLRGTADTTAPPPFLPMPVALAPSPRLRDSWPDLPPDTAVAPDRTAALLVIIPVYRDTARTRACLQGVQATLPTADSTPHVRVLILDDASPDPDMAGMLHSFADDPRFDIRTNPRNLGFPATVNLGLRTALEQAARATPTDVLLLNSDTLVAEGWLEELRSVAWSAPNIGTVTPLSNDATIMSYPAARGNAVPSLAQTRLLMQLAQRANRGLCVDVPTAHGFCMYIRHDCLGQTGLLRADLFAQGYGEENDFSLRARMLGWRNVAAPGAFVAHVGGISFGDTRAALLQRNVALLNRLHPGYDALVSDHVARDPLFEARRRLDLLRWRRGWSTETAGALGAPDTGTPRRAVLLVTHDYGGGVERVVQERAQKFRQAGIRPIILRPVEGGCRIEGSRPASDSAPHGRKEGTAHAADPSPGSYPNLRYRLPTEWMALLRLLTADPVLHVEWHHASGHHMALRELAAALGVPYDVYVHDYIWFCPRISLMGVHQRYCGEPDLAGCEQCLARLGRNVADDLPVADYVARSARELKDARAVIAPSQDAARRMQRHFPGLRVRVEVLEDDRPELELSRIALLLGSPSPAAAAQAVAPPATGRFRVCIIGAIGPEKGYDILLAAARDARFRRLPLEYVVVGHTPDDMALMETGHVYVTGPYREEEAVALVRAQKAQYGLLPSVWPETWCLTLGIAWKAGLNVAAFDLGAVADRIRATGRGYILPLGVSVSQLNMIVMSLCQNQATVPRC